MSAVWAEDYSGHHPDDGPDLPVRAEGPTRRPVVYLPRSVATWMIYCQSGEMRAHALREGNFSDTLANGWSIRWDGKTGEYVLRKRGRAAIRTTVKHEAYRIAESDGQRRP